MRASSAPIARHVLPLTARVDAEGSLSVGGCDLVQLSEEHGTPLFVYDEEHLRDACRRAVSAFGPGIAYGTKAFLCKAMAALAHSEGMSLDVATGEELAVCVAAGVPPDRLIVHGSNKSARELEQAARLGAGRIVVDSFEEISRLTSLARSFDGALRLLVRVNPGIEAHTHEYVMTGQDDSKFGFSLTSGAAREAVASLSRLRNAELIGVHAHIGSQIFRTESFARTVAVLAPFVLEHGFEELSVGGGLGVAYLNDEAAPSFKDWADVLQEACRSSGLPESLRVTAEPGRAIVAAAALTLYRVGTVKVLPGLRTYVSVDGGMSDNPRPVLYGSGYEAFLPRATAAERSLAARVVGRHCESGDVLVDDARLPADLVVGDVLATPVTGAYGYSMASNYNRVGRPAVVFVKDGKARVVVRRETVEDLLALEAD